MLKSYIVFISIFIGFSADAFANQSFTVNVRQGSCLNARNVNNRSRVLRCLPPGTVVVSTGRTKNGRPVYSIPSLGISETFLASNYLREARSAATTQAQAQTVQSVNVRQGSCLNARNVNNRSRVLRCLPPGTEVVPTGEMKNGRAVYAIPSLGIDEAFLASNYLSAPTPTADALSADEELTVTISTRSAPETAPDADEESLELVDAPASGAGSQDDTPEASGGGADTTADANPSFDEAMDRANPREPFDPSAYTINLNDTSRSFPTSEVAEDYPTSQGPEYNASDSDQELCQFYVETESGRSSEIDQVKTRNCLRLIDMANRGEIPRDALIYTLNYLKLNLGELQDESCIRARRHGQLENSCQFQLNDLNQRVRGFPHRSPSYFIDLCDGGEGGFGRGLVHESFINRGTGSANNSYTDRSGRRTTTVGPFLTGSYGPFTPYRVNQAYRNIGYGTCNANTPIEDCRVPRLELIGLASSNNDSTAAKPMHVSPYRSSHGCPSIQPEDRWQMTALYRNGPSLVMNYGPERFHSRSSLTSCNND